MIFQGLLFKNGHSAIGFGIYAPDDYSPQFGLGVIVSTYVDYNTYHAIRGWSILAGGDISSDRRTYLDADDSGAALVF